MPDSQGFQPRTAVRLEESAAGGRQRVEGDAGVVAEGAGKPMASDDMSVAGTGAGIDDEADLGGAWFVS